MLWEEIPLISKPVCKKLKSWINPAILLKYSKIMTSSDTVNKGENGSAETLQQHY